MYWQYQYEVSRNHMVPLLEGWGMRLPGASMLDIGCGSGGGTCAMHDVGMRCKGYDINSRLIDDANRLKGERPIAFSETDLYTAQPAEGAESYDLVVLHDVFEHIDQKEEMMGKLKAYMSPAGRLLITFPPYYSAYGGHQQHLRAHFAHLPFFHLLPFAITFIAPRLKNEDPSIVEEVTKLHRLGMGMRLFERIVSRTGMAIAGKQAYLISPNHIRFGFKPIPAGPVAEIPVLSEVLCTGVVYLLAKQ